MLNETKKVSAANLEKVIESIRLLQSCSDRSEYTPEEINGIFADIEEALEETKSSFVYDKKRIGINRFIKSFKEEYTWLAGFMRNVDRFGEKEALHDPELNVRWTYRELNKDANRFANTILDKGLKKGDVVMFQLLNCPEFAFIYLACHKTGAVSCPINFRLSSGEIAITIDDSKPKVFVYDAANKKTVERALKISKFKPEIVIAVDGNGQEPIDGAVTYAEFVKNSNAEDPVLSWGLSAFDETTRLYTSGTTGMPKGVCLTSLNEVLSAHDVMIHFPMSNEDKTMNTTPWFHRGGLHSGGITPTFYAGGTVVIMKKFEPVTTLRYIEEYKLTFIIGVPNVLELLTEAQISNAFDLSSLNGIVTMGSPLERAACIRYQKILTRKIFNGYGTTETFWNTFLRPSELPAMAGTAGRACTDDDVRVVKVFDDRKAAPDELAAKDGHEVGEVIIKSHAKASYFYYENDDETEKKFSDGFMYTGDLATWDKDHFISIVGRKDDMIISGGENIYPVQVEEALNSNPKVADSIVTSVPDKIRGEIVTAYVVRADDSLTAEELEEFCKDSPMIANYKRPRYYRFITEVPVNATGKKLHYKIKEAARHDLINGLLIRV